ncbi:MAG: GNAT family N-acetyltransferase [Candidatus Thorarchaeota archaeon]|nr:GNAT family N-acetyltransferase [Candidatus Thorarchaeota archaeon]
MLSIKINKAHTSVSDGEFSMKNSQPQELPDGFEYGVVQTDEEMEEIIKFNEAIHGEDDALALRRLIDEYPNLEKEQHFYIRDMDKGIIVSSLNAIPSVWDYDGIALKNLELGYVGTHSDYRNQGLFRALYLKHFERQLYKGNYHLSTIMGIPYFYRQFGYDFVLPLTRAVMLDAREIHRMNPKALPSSENIVVRPAIPQDLSSIMQLYHNLCKRLLVTARRDESLWELQEANHLVWTRKFETFVVERDGEIEGYFRTSIRSNPKDRFHNFLDVMESSIRTVGAIRRVLEFLGQKCEDSGLTRIIFPGTSACHLSKMALDLGGTMTRGWKFQIRIPNILQFLKRIGPILERRLRNTVFEGLTFDLALNIYHSYYILQIAKGKIVEVMDAGKPIENEYFGVRMPPQDFVRLMLGEYNLGELDYYNTDFIVDGPLRSLLGTLFPKQESWIFYYFV